MDDTVFEDAIQEARRQRALFDGQNDDDPPSGAEGRASAILRAISGKRYEQSLAMLRYHIDLSPQNKTSWEICRIVARDLLRRWNATLPPDLSQWVADVLDDVALPRGAPPKRPRPRKGDEPNVDRNLHWALVVYGISLSPGIKATRNREGHRRSACDAVAKVWSKSYEDVLAVYGELMRLHGDIIKGQYEDATQGLNSLN